MYKIGIIGERDSVLGFMALGFAVHEVQGGEEASQKISELVKSGKAREISDIKDMSDRKSVV